VELLKRVLNHAVDCRRLAVNPLARCRLLRRPNVRKRSLGEADFVRLCAKAEPFLRPILILAYDTGMRLREVLDLRWDQVSLEDASVPSLGGRHQDGRTKNVGADTKGVGGPRVVPKEGWARIHQPQHPEAMGGPTQALPAGGRLSGPLLALVSRLETKLCDSRQEGRSPGVSSHEDERPQDAVRL
jgi:hypothetical protein